MALLARWGLWMAETSRIYEVMCCVRFIESVRRRLFFLLERKPWLPNWFPWNFPKTGNDNKTRSPRWKQWSESPILGRIYKPLNASVNQSRVNIFIVGIKIDSEKCKHKLTRIRRILKTSFLGCPILYSLARQVHFPTSWSRISC